MHQQDLKSYIRNWINRNRKFESNLGEVVIGNLLGEGGNALVFDTPFAGGTAIKFLAELVSASLSKRYARFLDEYRNLIKLVSTGAIAPIYQFGIQDMDDAHIPYIIMERCVRTLNDMVQSRRLVDVNEFKNLLERLLQILEIIHRAKIVHRDIKPQNILLRSNDTWVLGDFGIAWFDPELYKKIAQTDRDERLANWGFSAPEQIRRRAYHQPTPSMDLYALGQTLYYCVTGHVVGGTGHPRFSQIAPSLVKFDSLIDKLVRQEPSDRLETVQEVRQFLAEQQGSRGLADDVREETKRLHRFKREQEVFDEALRSAMPGAYRYKQAKSPMDSSIPNI
jgi:serine/threonine protein kinase